MADKKDLQTRIEEARSRGESKRERPTLHSTGGAAAKALHFSAAMVAAVVVGAFIGLAIDNVFNTGPWGLLIFLVFGMAAGFLNIIREAQKMSAEAMKAADETERAADDEGQ